MKARKQKTNRLYVAIIPKKKEKEKHGIYTCYGGKKKRKVKSVRGISLFAEEQDERRITRLPRLKISPEYASVQSGGK